MRTGFGFIAVVQLIGILVFGYLAYEVIQLLRDIFVA